MRPSKRQRQDGARARKGHEEPRQAAQNSQQHAFRNDLADQPRARGAQRHPDGGLRPRRGAAGQQQIGDVGAGDQQHEAGDGHEQAETRCAV